MDRRDFLMASAVVATSAGGLSSADPSASPPMPELSLDDISAAYKSGALTAVKLTQMYLDRIERLDRRGPSLTAVIQVNPLALQAAAQLDAELSSQGPRGPLHGVPVLIKDNVETADPMATTVGSLALGGYRAPQDAPLVERLRKAGAVILGKTNLSEWANFRSTHSSSGWSGRGGQTRNPYSLDRTPSGSSSGSAVAVSSNFCAIAVGTETDGSIVSPASINGIVGFKPTVGMISRRGIAPISHSQDTAGPLARSVRDAALMLTVLCALDSDDAASVKARAHFGQDYLRFLDNDGLRGARLGVARKFFADNAPLNDFLDHCLVTLKDAGAVIVDPADLPLHGAFGAAGLEVLLYEFKTDLNAYLVRLPDTVPVHSLADLIRYNDANKEREMPIFGQELLHQAQAKGPLTDKAYLEARATCLNATRTRGIDAVISAHKLDAMITLTAGPAWLIDPIDGDSDSGGCSSPAAIAGYPHITVPAGLHRGLPIGLSFFAGAFSEPTLLKLASGFENVRRGRVAPRFLPSANG